MSLKIPDLWSNDISSDVLTPLVILRAKIAGLERRTNGVLEAEVQSVESDKRLAHNFDLIAPALGFRERILIASHELTRVYPVLVEAAYFAATKGHIQEVAYSQEDFITMLRDVLQSPQVRSSIQSLIARSNEVRSVELPTEVGDQPPEDSLTDS